MIEITKDIRPGVSYYDVLCHWTEDRGGEEYLALYDLRKKKDFRLFVKMHGLFQALRYRRQNRWWWDGCYHPFDKTGPQATTEEGMARTINTEVWDWICERHANWDDINHWDQVLDIAKVRPLIP